MFDLPNSLQYLDDHPVAIVGVLVYLLIRDEMRMRYGMQLATLLKKHPEHAATIIDATVRRSRLTLRPPSKGD
ncbi:hypothetical protein [Mycolicibacterium nivoides]|uniref:Uncharacterized protein n=1 Tax=Mycolicibacterium nivoides TaxID=2487344 RepID=A0ABW9L6P4_9MYCO